MRILVFSDIHANLTALEAVIADAGDFQATWCLGDLVGYGPDPNECIQRVSLLPKLTCLIGNHDAAALGRISPDTFNSEARQALLWTQKNLTEASLSFLKRLPETMIIEKIDSDGAAPFTLVHGSPRQPIWEYLLDSYTATRNFDYFDTPYCVVGHTHIPVIYHHTENERLARLLIPKSHTPLRLTPRLILNPGSVGQPRDRDPRAAYAIYDTAFQTWEYRRVDYDISEVQQRMEAVTLPARHIRRIAAGW